MLTISKYSWIFLFLFLSTFSNVFGQRTKYTGNFFGLQSIKGIIGGESEYRMQKTTLRTSFSDELKSSILTGLFKLNVQNYLWHPNFMLMDTELEYNPGIIKDKYLVTPDRSEVLTGERANVRAIFLQNLPVVVKAFGSYNHFFVNREFTTDVETFQNGFGGGIIIRNDIAPFTFDYSRNKTDQKELQTGRSFKLLRHNIRAEIHKYFSKYNEHRLTYNLDDYARDYFSFTKIRTKTSSLNLRSNVFFDTTMHSGINSLIWYSRQSGSRWYDRFQVTEDLRIQLPSNFNYFGNYRYFDFKQNNLKSIQHMTLNQFENRLYKSLRTFIFYEYTYSNQTTFKEIINRGGIGLNYEKKIPTGKLSINYEFQRRNLDRNSLIPSAIISNEEYVLSDDKITLLNQSNIASNSIVVRDETGTLIYQEYIDYILIQRGSFIEIQRINGGLIANGATVYIDYMVELQSSYEYGQYTNIFSANINLFDRLLELYYRSNNNNYKNIDGIDSDILKVISQKIYGGRFSFGIISGGVEWEFYNSNIVPYESKRYYLAIQNSFWNKLNISISGNLRNFHLIDENEDQKFRDITGNLIYLIGQSSRISCMASYRIEEGYRLDLKINTFRGEFTTNYRQINFSFGVEGYSRDLYSEKINYLGGFAKIERRF